MNEKDIGRRHWTERFVLAAKIACLACITVSLQAMLWSAGHRPWLGHHYEVVSTIRTVPAARRHLDWYVEQLEREGLTRGNTAVLTQGPEDDLASWYGRLQTLQADLRRDEAVADPMALRRFRQVFRGEPAYLKIYPYQRLNTASGIMTSFSTILVCVSYALRDRHRAKRPSPAT